MTRNDERRPQSRRSPFPTTAHRSGPALPALLAITALAVALAATVLALWPAIPLAALAFAIGAAELRARLKARQIALRRNRRGGYVPAPTTPAEARGQAIHRAIAEAARKVGRVPIYESFDTAPSAALRPTGDIAVIAGEWYVAREGRWDRA